MKPIALKGHERPITQVKFNQEGDLLFVSSKDNKASVWYSENGERVGTYDGHNGVIWCLDVTYDTQKLVTGGGDNFCLIWDCETGKQINKLQSSTAVRTVGFSYSANLFFYTTDQRMKTSCTLDLFDLRDDSSLARGQPRLSINCPKSKVTSALFTHLDYLIVAGHENGEICQYDIRGTGSDPTNWVEQHKGEISDLQCSHDQIMLLSASKDQTAKLFDAQTLELLKTYKSERPVNSAAISPLKDHIVLGGGEEAMQVTQTDTKKGQFEAKIYHLIFEDEFGRVKGHFGPINSLMYHPDGKSYASGGEDGYVRVNTFDQDYYDFEFDY